MDRFGPSEDCAKCGATKAFGAPCECDVEERNFQEMMQEAMREEE